MTFKEIRKVERAWELLDEREHARRVYGIYYRDRCRLRRKIFFTTLNALKNKKIPSSEDQVEALRNKIIAMMDRNFPIPTPFYSYSVPAFSQEERKTRVVPVGCVSFPL